MINSRKIEDLVPEAQVKCKQFLSACEAAGLKVLVISTKRDAQYQASLYAQGRTMPGGKVTNADGVKNKSYHQSGNAWDATPVDSNGIILWNDSKKFKQMAEIAVSLGITAGYYFRSLKDSPHFQI